jgi:hypothetical protein
MSPHNALEFDGGALDESESAEKRAEQRAEQRAEELVRQNFQRMLRAFFGSGERMLSAFCAQAG